jgi:copper chaperone CopZ
MDERTYTVAGMSCDHCVLSVEEEIGSIGGYEVAR